MPILLVCAGCYASSHEQPHADVERLLGDNYEAHEAQDDMDEWTKVLEPREFRFPRDHGAHRDYKIEWWYYTGNLETADKRRFGYQLTFFRTGLQRAPENPSRWTIRDLYTAHFAISDIQERKFHRFQRNSRGALDWAGANEHAGRIWNGPWQLHFDEDQQTIEASQDNMAIKLALEPAKPPVPHGRQGLSQKGPSPGNASYYYSFTRLKSRGTITVDGNTYDVSGLSWMDHEFSSSFLEEGQLGWDWFSLQLDGDRELMIYQIRRKDGSIDPHSSGTLVAADGSIQPLSAADFELTPLDTWQSPVTQTVYPIQWRLQMPAHQTDLTVTATFPSQEMDTRATTGIIYWEGSIDVSGRFQDKQSSGRGYLELTGYAKDSLGS